MTLLHGDLEREVLKKIRPTEEEVKKRDEIFEKVRHTIEETIAKRGLSGEVTLQGSAKKGTWLRGNLELDVFVLFPPKDKAWIREIAFPALLEAAKRLGVPETRFAEHPYVRVVVEGVPVEIVPAFKVRSASEAITAVDRTPFHTQWFLEKVKELGDWVVEEVRLLKAFLKGIGAYGAELKVRGFSGYMTEILIIYYKGFAETIKAISKWRPSVILETSLKKDEARKRFPGAPLVAPDPVDPKRNAGAAVSLDTLALAELAARRYIERPSLKFYFDAKPPREAPKLPTYLIKVPLVEGSPPETVWGELRRIAESLVKHLKRLGFPITRYALWSDEKSEAKVCVEVLQDVLPDYEVKLGPPVWLEKNVKSFLEKHENPIVGPWVEGGRLLVIEKRKVRRLDEAAIEHLKRMKAESLNLSESKVSRVTEPPKEAWLAWFVTGKPKWW